MSFDSQSLQHIQVENVIDYAQYINQVAGLDAGIQGLQGLQSLPDGTTVAFIDASIFDASQILDNGTIEVQTLTDASQELQQHQVVVEPTPLQQISVQTPAATTEPQDVKPPIGKGPFNCNLCDKVFNKWNQLQRHLKTHDDDKPFKCSKCPKSFNIESNLLLHLATHVGSDQDLRCPECGKKFSRVASLKSHIMLHEKEESLMCPECGDEFTVQHQLDKHMETHRSDVVRVHTCRQCQQEFTKMSALKEHMKEHYKVKASLSHRSYKRNLDRSGFSHKCEHCTKTFQKPSQLERHERIHTGERPFECNICQRTFNQKGALQMHMAKHTGSRPHKCSFCPQSFSQKGNLRAHIKRVHTLNKSDGEVVYKCEECSCMFRRLGSLNAHISRAHADQGDSAQSTVQDIKNHGLPLGDLTDSSMIPDMIGLEHVGNGTDLVDPSLGEGQVLHGSLDQGASDILQQALENSGLPSTVDDDQDSDVVATNGNGNTNLGKTSDGIISSVSSGDAALVTVTDRNDQPSMSRQGTMAVHDSATGMLKRHYIRKVNGIRWHQCTYCTKEFKKPSDLVRHIRIHTHEKPYKCNQCFSAFAVKSTLTAHVKTHTGVKEFRCEVCSKMFSTQGSLKVHLRLHTGAKPFSCTQCDKKFRTSAHCKSHIMSHFKDPDSKPRSRRPFKRDQQQSSLLAEIPLQEPILITDNGLIQQQPKSNNMFPPYANESGNSERPHRCQHCRRGFKKSSHLKQHIRSHTGEKPFRCNLCYRSFVSSGVLKAHARTHSGLKSFKCVVCDTLFTTSGSLKRHMSTHSEVRPFMCPYCQKTFKTSVNCKKHMKTHRHELAMQHYRSVSDPQEGGEEAEEEDTREDEEVEVVDDVSMQPQTIADLRAVQQLELRHPTSSQELQVVEMGQADLQAAGITTEALSLDGGLSQSFGQGMFGQNFTLVGQQQFVQLGQGQEGQQSQQGVDGLQRVTVQLESTDGSEQGATQFTYQPQSWKSAEDANQTQETTIHIINNSNTISEETGQDGNEVDEQVKDAMEQLREDGEIVDSGLLGAIGEEDSAAQLEATATLLAEPPQISSVSTVGRRGFRCQICNKMFKRSGHLSQHMRLHTNSKYLRCPECPKSFSSAAVLRGHLRVHKGLQAHLCSICNAAFSTPGALRKHMLQHSSQPMLAGPAGLETNTPPEVMTGEEYTCVLCNQQFRNAAQLRRHVKDCQVSTYVPESALIAVKTNDENRAPKRGPPRRRPLFQQIVSEEQFSISEKILIESTSEKDRISMPKEVENHTIKQERFANMCPHCPKSFKKPSDLQRHMRIHTGEKPFSCNICNRSFTVKSTLDSHMKTHGSSKKTFVCHVCQSLFSTKGSLKVHMRLHTGAKPFKCIHCDQRFRTSGHRKSHMVSHFKTDVPVKKKASKPTTHQPLVNMNSPQNASVSQQPQQTQQQILCLFTKDNVGQPSANQQVLAIDQPMPGQVLSVDQGLGNQVISVDQSLLQNQALVPVQLAVNDNTTAMETQALPTQITVPQGMEGNGLQLQIAPLGQMNQGFQLPGLEQGFLQQAVQIDASLLQQLQQNGFITINPNGIQPNITADLSQVGGDIGANIVLSAAASSSVSANDLISQQAITGAGNETLLRHQVLQDADGSNTEATLGLGQTLQVSESILNQLRSEGLIVQPGADSMTAISQQHQPGTSSSIQMLGSHRISDTLLSQQPQRLHRPGVDALIGQSSHVSQENYLQQGVAHSSDTMIGQDRLNGTDTLMGRQISYGDAIGSAGDHSLIQSMPITHVYSIGDLQAHQLSKPEGDDMTNAAYLAQARNASQQQDLGLTKISEVDEEDKYMMPGDDQRMVAISALEQQAPDIDPDEDEGVGVDGSQDEQPHPEDQVDTTALIPTAQVGGLEKQNDGAERHNVCGICYKGFKRAAHLREHMATHGSAAGQVGGSGKKTKTTPHTCLVCFKAFQKPSQLERHMRIHTGERPFTCEICSKSFNQKNALQVHLRKHSGEKPHVCPYCSASFVQSGNLKTHIKRAHHTDMVSTMGFGQRERQQQTTLPVAAARSSVGIGQIVAADGSGPSVSLTHEGQGHAGATLAVGDGTEEEDEDEENDSKSEMVGVVGGLDMNDIDMFQFSYS